MAFLYFFTFNQHSFIDGTLGERRCSLQIKKF